MLHEELEKELERVTRERDQLANQLREDAQFLDNKVSFARQQGKLIKIERCMLYCVNVLLEGEALLKRSI